MRRLALLLFVAPVVGLAQVQSWEKLVAPGLSYRMEIDMSQPLVIHAIRYTPGTESITSRVELAKPTVFVDGDANKGRDTLTQTIARTGAIGGINGDFFPWSGDPLGVMVRHGELLSKPFPRRGVFAWGAGYMEATALTFAASAKFGASELTIQGLNEECGENMAILNTPVAGLATARIPAVHAILEMPNALPPSGTIEAKFVAFEAEKTQVSVGKGQAVLTATGAAATKLAQLNPGDTLQITVDVKGVNWEKAKHAIGGGPTLVIGGKAKTDYSSEGFNKADFIDKRHPRTAVGATKDGDIWFVVVDGRQPMSRGATIPEMANIMVRLGCKIAINLDGGGSSTIALGGVTLNRPSDGAERAISNSILLFGSLSGLTMGEAGREGGLAPMAITGLPRLVLGQSQAYTVIDGVGEAISNGEVLWSCSGAAWIDQAGVVRGVKAGPATISASVRGQVISIGVLVEAPPAPKT